MIFKLIVLGILFEVGVLLKIFNEIKKIMRKILSYGVLFICYLKKYC